MDKPDTSAIKTVYFMRVIYIEHNYMLSFTCG